MLTSSAVDHGFDPQSSQANDYKIGICSKCCFSAKHAAIRRKSKSGLARNQDTVSSGVSCLPVDCWSSTKLTSSSSHWKLTCSCHDIGGHRDCMVHCMQSVLIITTNVVSFNPAHGEVHLLQHYSLSELWQVCGFLWVLGFPPPIKLMAMI